jgi:hypothetical protein
MARTCPKSAIGGGARPKRSNLCEIDRSVGDFTIQTVTKKSVVESPPSQPATAKAPTIASVHMPGGTIQIEIADDYSIPITGAVTKISEGIMVKEMFSVSSI